MTLQILAPPGVEPVSLDQAKAFLRVTHADEDQLITDLIVAARERVEAETGRALITRTCRETLDDWAVEGRFSPPGTLKLPSPPLQAVTGITLIAADDSETVWSADDYIVDTDSDPGRIAVRGRSGFPRPGRRIAGIRIDFTAGYGDGPEDVPAALKEAVLRLVGEGYPDRDGALSRPLPLSVVSLIAPYRRVRL
ncbi:head-tail connector protein [Hyphobacterium marinum]|uniref:Head-tail connector protein n=1 Tax=Hyphobacterium marinum TaxID=3116574 RepID=A0ABU7M0V7_9PROT|nr:head-tail connector protein [Hyphobacterium sp. Y6023]MEE2567331.1 head-tail connector protein [Hyphobacterium sp. Y6023]